LGILIEGSQITHRIHIIKKREKPNIDLHCILNRRCGSAAGDPGVPNVHGDKAFSGTEIRILVIGIVIAMDMYYTKC
jgi:hypothetical protein